MKTIAIHRIKFARILAGFIAALLAAHSAQAQNAVDNFTGSTIGSLLTPGNWSLGSVPLVSNDAVFPSTATTGIRTLTAGSLTVGSFNVLATTGTFSIRNQTSTATNSTLTLGGAGDLGNSVSGTAADLLYALSGSTFNITGPNGSTGSGVLNVVLGQSGNFDIMGTSTISAAISDGGNGYVLTKTGTGTLTLSGANSFSGVTMNVGTLNINNDGALGAGTFTINGGAAGNLKIDNTSGSAKTLSTVSQFNLSGDITFLASNPLNLGTGPVTLGSNPVIFRCNTTLNTAKPLTIGGNIASTANGLQVIQGAFIVLSGTNSYSGPTAYKNFGNQLSMIRADDGVGLPAASNLAIETAGVFETGKDLVRVGGTGAGQMAIGFNIKGNLGFSAFGGPVNVCFGSLASPTALTWGTAPFNTGSNALILNYTTANNTLDFKNSVNLGSAVRTVETDANVATMSGVLSGTGGLTKTGAGTLVLSNTNTYTGNTTVSAGSLTLDTAGTLKFAPAANGVCNKVTGAGTATLNGTFNIDLTNAAIANGNSWTLVDVTTKTSALTAVTGFTGSAGVWTKVNGSNTWTYTESTGVLSLGPTTYTLTYTADPNGSISGSTPQTVNYNASGTAVTAVPATGYHFVNWSDSSTANPRTDSSVTANVSVTANFAINTYTLAYTAGANGSISGSTPQTVNYNTSGTSVTAVPATGYHFVNWSDSSTANPRTDSNVTANVSVTANFAINTSYTLTYTAGANGSISGTSPQTVASGGNGTSVTAVADTGYHFVNWSDSSTSNPRTDSSVTADVSVTANFAINTYTLTYTAGANGSITGTTPQTVNYNTSGTSVTAVADTGYHFVSWSDSSTSNPRTDSGVTANVSVTASFAINTIAYNTWAATYAGGGSPNGDSNNDGVKNGIAFFMNATGAATLPGLVGNTVTWTNGGNIPASEYGTQFVVQTSTDLVVWQDVPSNGAGLSNTAGSVSYTLPTGQDKFFCRLSVTPQ